MSRWLSRESNELPDALRTNGCFETMRVYGGKSFRLRGHLERLYASAQYLQTDPALDIDELERQLIDAVAAAGHSEALLRVALMPQSTGKAEASIAVQSVQLPEAEAFANGIAVAVVPSRSFPVSVIDPRAKYSARMASKLAVMDAQVRKCEEALFMDSQGYVTENTASNYAIVARDTLLTPPCYLGLLWGITRQMLFECAAALNLRIEETPLTRHDIYNAQEVFLTSTIKEVLPVNTVDGRQIANGKPGSISRSIHRKFIEIVGQELGVPVVLPPGAES